MGPMCFDYGFGPFRWVCASGESKDLEKTDQIATNILSQMAEKSPRNQTTNVRQHQMD